MERNRKMILTHIRLLVQDYGACFRFYRDVMGFPVVWGDEESGYADFKFSSGSQLALFGRREMAEVVGTKTLPAEAASQDRAMLIFEVQDLWASVTELKNRGAQIEMDIADYPGWGIRAAYLRDPDGTLIELNSPLPRLDWSDDLVEKDQRFE
jgi:catechol 2,3-dioxygenase-like lactoylglutathione lyase family enzyme